MPFLCQLDEELWRGPTTVLSWDRNRPLNLRPGRQYGDAILIRYALLLSFILSVSSFGLERTCYLSTDSTLNLSNIISALCTVAMFITVVLKTILHPLFAQLITLSLRKKCIYVGPVIHKYQAKRKFCVADISLRAA